MSSRHAGFAVTAALAFAAGALWAESGKSPLDSRIFSAEEARSSKGSWGGIRIYTEDGTPSFGTRSVLTAIENRDWLAPVPVKQGPSGSGGYRPQSLFSRFVLR
jgi:hypothetical protein